MKTPLNYAILKYFTTVDRASADDVIAALRPEYGDYKALKRAAVVEAIMTAESNALLTEMDYELDEKGVLQVYYTATPEQKETIYGYLGR